MADFSHRTFNGASGDAIPNRILSGLGFEPFGAFNVADDGRLELEVYEESHNEQGVYVLLEDDTPRRIGSSPIQSVEDRLGAFCQAGNAVGELIRSAIQRGSNVAVLAVSTETVDLAHVDLTMGSTRITLAGGHRSDCLLWPMSVYVIEGILARAFGQDMLAWGGRWPKVFYRDAPDHGTAGRVID